MNKLLLGTTALVGASLLMAGAAYAAKPKVTVGGYFDFQLGGSSQDSEAVGTNNAPHRGYSIRTDSELHMKAKGKTDAGMNWSYTLQLEADGNTTMDENVLSYFGSWGRINLGMEDGAEDLMQHGKPYSGAGDGGVDGDWIEFVDWNGVNSRLPDGPKMSADSSDNAKLTYFTPRIGGLQGGVSFTPDTGASGQTQGKDDDGDFENTWGLGVNFKKKFGAVAVAVSGVLHVGNAERKKKVEPQDFSDVFKGTGTVTFQGREDLLAWGVGAEVSSGAWSVGGMYTDSGDGGEDKGNTFDQDVRSWSAGVGYSQGPLKLGVSYLHGEVETEEGDDEGDVVAISATYSLGGGARVLADLVWFDTDDANNGLSDNDGFGFLLGASIKF